MVHAEGMDTGTMCGTEHPSREGTEGQAVCWRMLLGAWGHSNTFTGMFAFCLSANLHTEQLLAIWGQWTHPSSQKQHSSGGTFRSPISKLDLDKNNKTGSKRPEKRGCCPEFLSEMQWDRKHRLYCLIAVYIIYTLHCFISPAACKTQLGAISE